MLIRFKCFEQIKRMCSNLVHNSCMQICDTVSWLSKYNSYNDSEEREAPKDDKHRRACSHSARQV